MLISAINTPISFWLSYTHTHPSGPQAPWLSHMWCFSSLQLFIQCLPPLLGCNVHVGRRALTLMKAWWLWNSLQWLPCPLVGLGAQILLLSNDYAGHQWTSLSVSLKKDQHFVSCHSNVLVQRFLPVSKQREEVASWIGSWLSPPVIDSGGKCLSWAGSSLSSMVCAS